MTTRMASTFNIARSTIVNPKPEPKTFLNTIVPNDLLYDTVLSFCTPASFLRLSRTCRSANAAVKYYMGRIDKLLSRFFTSPLAFRQLQGRTGTLVYGSAALQFFDRSYYPDGDLDVYASLRYRFEAAKFLFREGYRYIPERDQDPDFRGAASTNRLRVDEFYPTNEVLTVLRFMKRKDNGNSVRTQLIVARNSPIGTILGFHSSASLITSLSIWLLTRFFSMRYEHQVL